MGIRNGSPCSASSRCTTSVTLAPFIPVYGIDRTNCAAVHGGGCAAEGRGVSGLGSSRATIHNTPLISLHYTADDMAACDAETNRRANRFAE